jgi:hypothetical protein
MAQKKRYCFISNSVFFDFSVQTASVQRLSAAVLVRLAVYRATPAERRGTVTAETTPVVLRFRL